ncbi:endocytosis defective- protein [Physocladia obscura]|uniref:Endocytosis defective- protein n=1 Tax=Physocladia obscura TaxID=109957 RepID=A0AAD5T4Y4_9FUNG|nr:endocytosis defective- protein [Physocladia obscura]
MGDFDWYVSPSDRFNYESKFSKFSNDDDEVTLSQLEPLYQTSHLSQNEFAQIWTLISLSQPSINQEQFIYFQHVLASRRRGRPLPVGIPLAVKEAFLKAKPESKMFTRYIPGTRDIAASTWKDAAQLQEEAIIVERDIVEYEKQREEAEARLADLTQTSDEMGGLASYKRNHLNSVRDDVAMLRESVKLLKSSGVDGGNAAWKAGENSGGSGFQKQDINDIIAKLQIEKQHLEARKRALQSQI